MIFLTRNDFLLKENSVNYAYVMLVNLVTLHKRQNYGFPKKISEESTSNTLGEEIMICYKVTEIKKDLMRY